MTHDLHDPVAQHDESSLTPVVATLMPRHLTTRGCQDSLQAASSRTCEESPPNTDRLISSTTEQPQPNETQHPQADPLLPCYGHPKKRIKFAYSQLPPQPTATATVIAKAGMAARPAPVTQRLGMLLKLGTMRGPFVQCHCLLDTGADETMISLPMARSLQMMGCTLDLHPTSTQVAWRTRIALSAKDAVL